MGHAVHNNLSATRYTQQSDIYVQWDFVEAPSQMLEDVPPRTGSTTSAC